jgi:hypothetical protein
MFDDYNRDVDLVSGSESITGTLALMPASLPLLLSSTHDKFALHNF